PVILPRARRPSRRRKQTHPRSEKSQRNCSTQHPEKAILFRTKSSLGIRWHIPSNRTSLLLLTHRKSASFIANCPLGTSTFSRIQATIPFPRTLHFARQNRMQNGGTLLQAMPHR